MKKRLLSIMLTLCMVFCFVPTTAFAADSTVNNETELKSALENTDCAEIKLGGNIETTDTLDVERTVTLDLNGYALSCSSTYGDIIRVRSSGSLTIKDSGTGGRIDGQNRNCGFDVKGGTLTLESGSIVNCKTDGDGGAVDVSNTGVTETPIKYGKFIMNGGAIMDCKADDDGAAVDIGSGCTFTLNGGTISDCKAEDDGGAVFIKQGGFFVMNGGTIENCSAYNNGGAINIYENGSFTMTGGTIKDCKVDLGGLGNAVYGKNNTAIVSISGGTIENCGASPLSFDILTVSFDSDGGTPVAEQKVLNAPVVRPADPEKAGYIFGDWYVGETRFDFSVSVNENTTLKAKWMDAEKPTGEINIGTNKWCELFNNITFELFFKDTQTVGITASDNSGETVTIEYLLSDKALTEAELANSSFSAYTAPFDIEPDNEYIIYARMTDTAGNTGYICSDGIVLDGTSPVISGIENGKTYCEAQTVTVTEKYVKTVTVNGTAITLDENGSFVLTPANGKQKIVVTDKAGNTAEMTATINDGHTVGEWVSNGDGTHTRRCTVDGCQAGTQTENCIDADKNHKCDICGYIISKCADTDKDHICDYCGKVVSSHTGGKATCKDKAVCEVCGEAYGELDANNHSDLKYIAAKTATKVAEGNTEYWYCEGCGKYYSDAAATKEITKADTVTAKEITKADTVTAKLPDNPKSIQTGDTSNLALWIVMLFVSGSAAIGITVVSRKKKFNR